MSENNCRGQWRRDGTEQMYDIKELAWLSCGLNSFLKTLSLVQTPRGREFRLWNDFGTVFRAVHSGGAKGAVAPARKTKCFFSNIVSDFAGLFLVAILVRNLTKTEFAPADKKS